MQIVRLFLGQWDRLDLDADSQIIFGTVCMALIQN